MLKQLWKRFLRLFRKTKVVTGARAKLLIDGKVVAVFDSVKFTDQTEIDPINVLGKLEVVDVVPEKIEMNCSVTRYTKREENG